MPRRATITLYIDPKAHAEESGQRLTKPLLDEIARDVNMDAAPIHGYEGYSTKFVNIPKKRKH